MTSNISQSVRLTVSGHFHHKQAVLGSQGDPLPICTEEDKELPQV